MNDGNPPPRSDAEFDALIQEFHRVQLLLAINIALVVLILFMPW